MGSALQWAVGDWIKTYQVDSAMNTVEQPYDFLGMSWRIVYPLKHYVFKRNPALPREIVWTDGLNYAG